MFSGQSLSALLDNYKQIACSCHHPSDVVIVSSVNHIRYIACLVTIDRAHFYSVLTSSHERRNASFIATSLVMHKWFLLWVTIFLVRLHRRRCLLHHFVYFFSLPENWRQLSINTTKRRKIRTNESAIINRFFFGVEIRFLLLVFCFISLFSCLWTFRFGSRVIDFYSRSNAFR